MRKEGSYASTMGVAYGLTTWSIGSGTVQVEVDTETFAHTVKLGGEPWLSSGEVALRCDGERWTSSTNLTGGAVVTERGTDPTLGAYASAKRSWSAPCGNLTTEIRGYAVTGDIEFVTKIGRSSLASTAACDSKRSPLPLDCPPATEFPSLVPQHELGWYSWAGNSLHTMMDGDPPSSVNLTRWFGGLDGGPLVLYAWRDPAPIEALVIGSSNEFKVGTLSRLRGRIVGGAHGFLTSIPADFEIRFALVGRNEGITSAMFGYGAMLRTSHESSANKLSLAEDPLSAKLHYLTDGGSLLNYCDYWPACTEAPGGCTPMGTVLTEVADYHRSIDIEVALYHVDPYWYSHSSLGGCDTGVNAVNFTASPFHFPLGLSKLGLDMMLFLQSFATPNVYSKSFQFTGLSVSGADSAEFFAARFSELNRTSRLRALTVDGLPNVWLSGSSRLTTVTEQAAYERGLAEAALSLRLPIRVDQELPNDVLASVLFGSRTVGRCTTDSNPSEQSESVRWKQLGENSLFLRSVGMRPMVDVLWTTSQQTDPRWTKPYRPNILHDAIRAVLSTGPVGFGDLINCTDASLLARATRKDGTILKPASAALRIERFYAPPPFGGAEIWTAPSALAGNADPANDARANSMAALEKNSTRSGVWWWNILATEVDDALPAGKPLDVLDLWPTPTASQRFLVFESSRPASGTTHTPCKNGTLASDCLRLWSASQPLAVGAKSADLPSGTRDFKLLAAAPILGSGWTLLGDLTKFVPMSPQRFLAAPKDSRLSGALRDADLSISGVDGLVFTVLGSAGEEVAVTAVAPSTEPLGGRVIEVNVLVGSNGRARVECVDGACAVLHV